MNTDIVVAVVTGLFTFLASYLGAKYSHKDNSNETKANVELSYTQHMPEFWDHLNKITKERDELRDKVDELLQKINRQSEIIQDQSIEIESLNEKINKISNDMTTNELMKGRK